MQKEFIEHNIRLLEEKLRKTGLPEKLIPELREKIRSGRETAFMLPFETKIDNKKASGDLYIEKNLDNGSYEFNFYSFQLAGKTDAPIRQNIFPMGTGYETTVREAVNLMEGRSIYREPAFDPEHDSYWVKLDPADPTLGIYRLDYQRIDFRAEKAITDSPLNRLLKLDEKKDLAEALEHGERKAISVETMGLTKKLWVEASPQLGLILLQDQKGKPFRLPQIGRERHLENEIMGHSRGMHR